MVEKFGDKRNLGEKGQEKVRKLSSKIRGLTHGGKRSGLQPARLHRLGKSLKASSSPLSHV